ncbi:MAG: LAGLIDADG family homing endonuclease [archaeon]
MPNQLYLEIGSGQQAQVLKHIKESSGISWKEIAKILGVKNRMIFFYLKEKSRLPQHRLIELAKQKNFDLKSLEKLKTVKMANFEQKDIRKPELNKELAEFLGALDGDGNIDPKNHRVCITCDATTDFDYVTRVVRNMFADLFLAKTTISIRNGGIRCQIYSKELADYLESQGIAKGDRKNRIFIPKSVSQNGAFLCAFIRGVFDTDGSFHRKRENSAVVEFISCSPKFLQQIKDSLTKLGFKASLSGKSVYIYDQKHVDTFFKVVKPNNYKHCLKYEIFKKTGKVPLDKEFRFASVV